MPVFRWQPLLASRHFPLTFPGARSLRRRRCASASHSCGVPSLSPAWPSGVPSLSLPGLSFAPLHPFPSVGCANGGPSLFHCSVLGPHGGGQRPSPLAKCNQGLGGQPPPPPPESANLAANESAAHFTRLRGRDQNFGGRHQIRPTMRWLAMEVSFHFAWHSSNQCCTQNFGVWQILRILPTWWAPRRLGGGGGFGTRPRYLIVCLWRRLLASRHCTF